MQVVIAGQEGSTLAPGASEVNPVSLPFPKPPFEAPGAGVEPQKGNRSMYSVNDDYRCAGCGGKVPKIGTPRYEAAKRNRGDCQRRKAKVANKEVDVCGAFDPFVSDGDTRYDRYIGTKCHDPRHEDPCPLPCLACDHECDGPYVRYFDVTRVQLINADGSPTTRISPCFVVTEEYLDDMKRKIDDRIRELQEIRSNIVNVTDGPRIHHHGPNQIEWASPETIRERLLGGEDG